MVAHRENQRSQRSAPNSTLKEMQHQLERPAELAREYPMSSMLVVFGLGLGVGVALSQVLCSSMAGSYFHEPTFTEKLSKQISDAVHQVLPDSMSRQLSRLGG